MESTCNERYDAFEDEDEFFLGFHSSLASKESKTTSDRIKFSLAETARKGRHHGTPPFGYDKIDGKLMPNSYQAAIVKQIFDLYLKSGWGFQKIANHLKETGIPSPRNGYKWYDITVKCIISNPHYTGKLVQRRESVKNNKLFLQEKGYKERIKNDSEQHAVVYDTHEPLISNEVFMEAQSKWKVKSAILR
ncbi:recombinase family protein [Paenibacillus mendelii]|uniref:Recombinase family protein n=1 Tax=Paenibacillus mendelii TaxID=206163 RepID=A0ABV6JCJ5_9BACL|nr:recombinase family protein [Paenibacillus mendelii]MCQ6561614.1 recombinase family protein [Paenibacillus mendelii]